MDQPLIPAGYGALLEELKTKIRAARIKLAYAANRGLITLYWNIGRSIVERQKTEGWGRSVVVRLGQDLQKEFPGQKGFSPWNIWRMRSFYLAWDEAPPILARSVPEIGIPLSPVTESIILPRPVGELLDPNLPQAVAEITWGQNIDLIHKLKNSKDRLWYARQALENAWTRDLLVYHIKSGLHKRQGNALTNFRSTLPPSQAQRAQEIVKDTYNLDFIALEPNARERDLESGMIANVSRTLLELGAGFAFVGRQVPLSIGGRDYCLDLLFYNLQLRCYFVIELKAGDFKPEHVGKLGFYLSAVDDTRRHKDDGPSVGMIICRSKDRLIVEYALRNSQKPIGVATYTFTKSLPEGLRGKLPSAEQIEAALNPKREGGPLSE